ncbi:hypothetical protein GCM10022224_002900 [Nonomuraea antimicrobica]|uniref:Uncharacterized protein n=1 Tax=Nonomuraea antimicrobica TaxID=561173 RepID=A0ABP7B017_9ACTN
MAACTRRRVSSETWPTPLATLETVATDTPASRAISWRVVARLPRFAISGTHALKTLADTFSATLCHARRRPQPEGTPRTRVRAG